MCMAISRANSQLAPMPAQLQSRSPVYLNAKCLCLMCTIRARGHDSAMATRTVMAAGRGGGGGREDKGGCCHLRSGAWSRVYAWYRHIVQTLPRARAGWRGQCLAEGERAVWHWPPHAQLAGDFLPAASAGPGV